MPCACTRGLHTAFCRAHATSQLRLLQAVEEARAGKPGYPKPGSVHHWHFSPPCQSLSPMNGWRSLDKVLASVPQCINEVCLFYVCGI